MSSRIIMVVASALGVACSGSDGQGPAVVPVQGAGGGAGVIAPPASGAGGSSVTTPAASGGTSGSVMPPGAGGVPAIGGGGAPAAPGSGGQPVSGGAPGVAGAAATSGGASSSAGGATGAGGAPVVDPPGTAVITSGTFTVQPGAEVFECQNFDNPFAGKDTALSTISSELVKGSHHLHLYNLTEGDGPEHRRLFWL